MKSKFLILTFLFLLFGVKSVLAGNPPTLLTPTNGTTVNSSRLEWQIPSYSLYNNGNPYMVQVDDRESFVNPEKNNIYLTNNYYTPQLNPGTWFWRVKAKDISGIWSDWSTIWSFVLSNSTPSPSPSQTQSPILTPAPSASQQPNSSFTISNIPSQINSDQSFSISVNLSLPENPNTNFYLKGAFKKAGSSNYFGLTKVGTAWIKNSSTYTSQYKITTDSSGNWSGSLEVKADPDDKGYTGTDDYIFKVGKYNSTDSSPSVSWSDNESTIKIISTESDKQDSTLTNNPSSITNSPTSSQPIKTKTTTSNQTKSYDRLAYRIASVAGATASATTSASSTPSAVKNQKKTNPIIWIGLIFIFAGSGAIGYIYLKKNAKIHIPFRK